MAEHGKREGQQLGNYRLIHLLGRTHFSEVYLGEHLHLSALVAIKVLQTNVAESEASSFHEDTRTIAHLFHPNIVRFLDFAVKNGILFLVMEYALNGTVRQRHPKGTCLMLENVVSYVQQLASTLGYAYDRQLIHRDVKPQNMLLYVRKEMLLSDFGLVVLTSRTHSYSAEGQVARELTEITESDFFQHLLQQTQHLHPDQS